MIIALLTVIVAILLFGDAAVRGFLKGIVAWGVAIVALHLVIGFATSHYDSWSAEQQSVADKVLAKRITLEAIASRIQKPQASLLDVETCDVDDDFEMCGRIAG